MPKSSVAYVVIAFQLIRCEAQYTQATRFVLVTHCTHSLHCMCVFVCPFILPIHPVSFPFLVACRTENDTTVLVSGINCARFLHCNSTPLRLPLPPSPHPSSFASIAARKRPRETRTVRLCVINIQCPWWFVVTRALMYMYTQQTERR